MSSVKSRVKRALSDEQTRGTSGQSETGMGSGSGGMQQSETSGLTSEELTEAVKKGLTEALEERAEQKQEGELASTRDSSEESGSSGRGSMMRLMVLGALVAIGMLARRRLQSGGSQSSPDYQEPGE